MKNFIIVDRIHGDVYDLVAQDHDQAALIAASQHGLDKCLSPKLVCSKLQSTVSRSMTYVDEATEVGWGPGCPFEGQTPEWQVILMVIER